MQCHACSSALAAYAHMSIRCAHHSPRCRGCGLQQLDPSPPYGAVQAESSNKQLRLQVLSGTARQEDLESVRSFGWALV
eukprot:368857-Pelagomonas_calceolata.AAC.3